MIPDEQQVKALWDKYNLPEQKRLHMKLVAKVAMFLAKRCKTSDVRCQIKEKLLLAAALLHDIDKNVPKLSGEQHPDAAVRILRQEGMDEVADLVKKHPLHAILDVATIPTTWEEKLLFLADKMVKYEVLTVDKRFALWNEEHLPPPEQDVLDRAYPKVKALEREIFDMIGVNPYKVASLVEKSILN